MLEQKDTSSTDLIHRGDAADRVHDRGFLAATTAVQHDTDDEGTWWWEMSLPKNATWVQIQQRYDDLLAMRTKHERNWDDLCRLHNAYLAAMAVAS